MDRTYFFFSKSAVDNHQTLWSAWAVRIFTWFSSKMNWFAFRSICKIFMRFTWYSVYPRNKSRTIFCYLFLHPGLLAKYFFLFFCLIIFLLKNVTQTFSSHAPVFYLKSARHLQVIIQRSNVFEKWNPWKAWNTTICLGSTRTQHTMHQFYRFLKIIKT